MANYSSAHQSQPRGRSGGITYQFDGITKVRTSSLEFFKRNFKPSEFYCILL